MAFSWQWIHNTMELLKKSVTMHDDLYFFSYLFQNNSLFFFISKTLIWLFDKQYKCSFLHLSYYWNSRCKNNYLSLHVYVLNFHFCSLNSRKVFSCKQVQIPVRILQISRTTKLTTIYLVKKDYSASQRQACFIKLKG